MANRSKQVVRHFEEDSDSDYLPTESDDEDLKEQDIESSSDEEYLPRKRRWQKKGSKSKRRMSHISNESSTSRTNPKAASDPDYARKRERNNQAVRKSRAKKSELREEAMQVMANMRKEKKQLEDAMTLLTTDIDWLKKVLLKITGGSVDLKTSHSTSKIAADDDIIDLSRMKYFGADTIEVEKWTH